MERDPSSDKAGFNWVIPLKTVEHPDAMFNGRAFQAYLPLPIIADMEKYDGRGQKIYDAKMQRIAEFVTAAGGQVSGRTVMLAPGSKIGIKVVQQVNPRTLELSNSLDIFGEFKTAKAMGYEASGDGIPF
jgi:hypothetical protein